MTFAAVEYHQRELLYVTTAKVGECTHTPLKLATSKFVRLGASMEGGRTEKRAPDAPSVTAEGSSRRRATQGSLTHYIWS